MKTLSSAVTIILMMLLLGCTTTSKIRFDDKKYFQEPPKIVTSGNRFFLRWVYADHQQPLFAMSSESRIKNDSPSCDSRSEETWRKGLRSRHRDHRLSMPPSVPFLIYVEGTRELLNPTSGLGVHEIGDGHDMSSVIVGKAIDHLSQVPP